MRRTVILLAAFSFWLAQAGAAPAQNVRTEELVHLHAAVTNENGEGFFGLTREAFTVVEGDASRPIETFEVNAPASVIFVVDQSRSMNDIAPGSATDFAATVKRAVAAFAAGRHAPTEYALVGFGKQPSLVADFTSDSTAVAAAAGALDTRTAGSTKLYDACALATERLRQRTYPKRVVVIVSDGVDIGSDRSADDVLRLYDESDVLVFTALPYSVIANNELGAMAEEVLGKMATRSGGSFLTFRSQDGLVNAFTLIAAHLERQYTIGIRPTATKKAEYRRLTIRLPEGLMNRPANERPRVRARQGYRTRVAA